MRTDYLKESNLYERAASECYSLINHLNQKRNAEEEQARRAGVEPLSDYYALVIDEIRGIKGKFESMAKEYFVMHKREQSDLNENGIHNLLAAIVKSWAEDYEDAISKKDGEKIVTLRVEGKNLVRDTTIDRIERMHKAFVKTAHDRLFEIVEDTANAPKYTTAHGTTSYDAAHMRNRCPLCNGGMYARRIRTNTYLVKCARCYLSEVVEVGS